MPWLAPIRPHTSLAYNAHAASRSEQCRWQRLYHPQQKIPENSGFALPNNAGRSACRQADFICAHLWEPLPPVGIVAQLKLCRLLSPPPTQLLPPPPPISYSPAAPLQGFPIVLVVVVVRPVASAGRQPAKQGCNQASLRFSIAAAASTPSPTIPIIGMVPIKFCSLRSASYGCPAASQWDRGKERPYEG